MSLLSVMSTGWAGLAGVVVLALLAGCSRSELPGKAGEPIPVMLQTDWYAQAEHGGFYQAVATGLYRDAGLDVTINQGGPGAFGTQKVATGQTAFAIGRSDDVLLAVQQGLPLVIVSALMQHDPQALLLHADNPVSSFPELDGKTVMTTPGAAWVRFLEAKFKIRLNIVPLNYGLAQFMADRNFIQQCFITNEPYFVRKNGIEPKTLLISEAGYDPYRVIFTSQKFLREHPDVVLAFVAASARGWHDFLKGENRAAKALIRADNDKMDEAFIDFSVQVMNASRLVAGDPAAGEYIGKLKPERLQAQIKALADVGMLDKPPPLERFASFAFLPPRPPDEK